eukprot:SAG25_NODE_500_length_7380_cov_16.363137_4_plen_120_part_00
MRQARRIETALDSKIDSLTKLSSSGGASSGGGDVEAGQGQAPLLGENQMVDRLVDEIKGALDQLCVLRYVPPMLVLLWPHWFAACLSDLSAQGGSQRRDAAGTSAEACAATSRRRRRYA